MSEQNDRKDENITSESREKVIVRTGIIGIVTNLILVAFKMFIGILSNSIAVILDAVNNLSDALSSVVTIIGAKLASRQPDRKHPLGYGRLEYLSSMIVAALVLYAGITALVESIKKIIDPQEAEYGVLSIVIISVAIPVKLLLGLYVRKKGEKINSGALIASGSDALFDAVLSASVLASAIIYIVFDVSLEAYVGVVISLFIIRAGIEMMIDTVNDIIGKRDDKETIRELKRIICEEESVMGAYDVALFNYGPDRNYGTVHIELPDNLSVADVDRITRKVQANVFRRTGITLTGIGVYSMNTSDDEAAAMRDAVNKAVTAHDWALQTHGFYADTVAKTIRFDAVISFDIDRREALKILCDEVGQMYPGYEVQIAPDADLSD